MIVRVGKASLRQALDTSGSIAINGNIAEQFRLHQRSDGAVRGCMGRLDMNSTLSTIADQSLYSHRLFQSRSLMKT